jgi:hypothetical protein
MRPDPAPGLACLGGLLLTVFAFPAIPLLGSAFGAPLSGALAGLLARHPREAALQALGAGAVAVAVLGLLVWMGPSAVPGLVEVAPSAPVLVAQALLLAALPPLAGWGAGALASREPPGEGREA